MPRFRRRFLQLQPQLQQQQSLFLQLPLNGFVNAVETPGKSGVEVANCFGIAHPTAKRYLIIHARPSSISFA
jgi:hypothetical protein